MGEIARRASEVAAKTASDTVSPVVTALLATAAVVTHRPELAVFSVPAGAFAGAVTEQGLSLIGDAWHDRAERAQQFADAVAKETGQPVEDFITEQVTDGAKRELLGRIVEAATDARSAWKIRILARAFVRGAKDGDIVDETLLFVRLLSEIEPGHARALAVISIRPSLVSFTDAIKRDPGLNSVAPFLRRDLTRLDLIQEGSAVGLTDLGAACVGWLSELGDTDPEPGSAG